jgi:hypothetical protein
LAKLGWVASLLTVHTLPGGDGLLRALGVVVDRRDGEPGRFWCEQRSAEKAGLDEHSVRIPNGAISGLRDSIQPSKPNLEAALGGAELLADDAGRRRDRDDKTRTLCSHDR